MSEVDLSRLPTGEMGWVALVNYAASSDDRIERYFLEVKSDVDLNTKSGRAKVAKFILGSANRDPAQAARRFGGRAVMLLGVGGGGAPGIPAFEAQDLARDVGKWVGVDGLTWDFERIHAGGEQDVIAIVVEPPTGAMWTCLADGDGLADGDIYVRGDGNTRKATGHEIRAMLARAVTTAPAVDVEIEMVGEVVALGVDVDRLIQWIEWRADNYRQQVELMKASWPDGSDTKLGAFVALGVGDARSKAEFLAEVEDWRIAATASPTEGLVYTAGRLLTGVRVRVDNRTKTFLREVRIDIEINGNVVATEWLDPDPEGSIDLFPDSPINWGEKRYTDIALSGMLTRAAPTYARRRRHGIVDIERTEPVRLVMMMDDLRPEQQFASDEDEVVLLMIVDAAPTEAVNGTWRMTAAGINDVYEGDFTLPVTYRDWRAPIAKMLGDDDPGG